MNKKIEKIIEVNNSKYLRIPVKTKILTKNDDLVDIIVSATKGLLQENDIITISESPLAITQGRAVPIKDLKIGFLANFLWRFVANVKYGIGLRAPSSMQCAIDEVGSFRILFAAIVGGISKLFGRKGDFYRIAGMQAALIDAAFTSPIPPYDKCVLKGPLNPAKEAQKVKDSLNIEAAVMDINDIGGCWMIGGSSGIDKDFMEKVMIDNPQGQGDELTPICIVRKI